MFRFNSRPQETPTEGKWQALECFLGSEVMLAYRRASQKSNHHPYCASVDFYLEMVELLGEKYNGRFNFAALRPFTQAVQLCATQTAPAPDGPEVLHFYESMVQAFLQLEAIVEYSKRNPQVLEQYLGCAFDDDVLSLYTYTHKWQLRSLFTTHPLSPLVLKQLSDLLQENDLLAFRLLRECSLLVKNPAVVCRNTHRKFVRLNLILLYFLHGERWSPDVRNAMEGYLVQFFPADLQTLAQVFKYEVVRQDARVVGLYLREVMPSRKRKTATPEGKSRFEVPVATQMIFAVHQRLLSHLL